MKPLPVAVLHAPRFQGYYRARVRVDWHPTACWEWTGPLLNRQGGRPVACIGKDRFYAYRIAYYFGHGVDPGSQEVCHHCDNPLCCRPSHLFLGSQADNARDMWEKGRGRYTPLRGEAHGCATTPDIRVQEARQLYASGRYTQAELSVAFRVSQSTIGRWCRGEARSDSAGPRTAVGKGRNGTREMRLRDAS